MEKNGEEKGEEKMRLHREWGKGRGKGFDGKKVTC